MSGVKVYLRKGLYVLFIYNTDTDNVQNSYQGLACGTTLVLKFRC